jgi:predicted small metal-binding protein
MTKAYAYAILPLVKTRLQCPCGELLEGKDEEDLVEKAFAHLKEKHPELADEYTRDHILFMAY